MSENTEINFSINNITLERILSEPELLLTKLEENGKINNLKQYLFDVLVNKDGAPSFSNLQVKNVSYDIKNHKGKFRITYTIDRLYCCSEVESSNSDYIDFDYQYENNTINAHAKYFNWDLNN